MEGFRDLLHQNGVEIAWPDYVREGAKWPSSVYPVLLWAGSYFKPDIRSPAATFRKQDVLDAKKDGLIQELLISSALFRLWIALHPQKNPGGLSAGALLVMSRQKSAMFV